MSQTVRKKKVPAITFDLLGVRIYPLGGKIAELLPGKGPQRFIWRVRVRRVSTFDLLQIG